MAVFLAGAWVVGGRLVSGHGKTAPQTASVPLKEAQPLPEKTEIPALPEKPDPSAKEPAAQTPAATAPEPKPVIVAEPPAPAPKIAKSKPAEKTVASLAPAPAKPFVPPVQGVAAIIIDDIGQSMEAVERLLDIGQPIAFAILPGQAHSRQAAAKARERGQVVMLHLPMEPKGRENNPGFGALLASHDRAGLLRLVAGNLESVPGASGVNNHMGSLLTERMESMEPLMEDFKARGLFFVDSATSSGSVAYEAARRAGLSAARRDVFLDNERDVGKITEALDLMAAKARKNGFAVAIGHPYPETIRALELYAPRLAAKGIRLAPVTRLLNVQRDTGVQASRAEPYCAGRGC